MTSPIDRDHEEEMAYLRQEHELEEARIATERSHELSLIEAQKEFQLEELRGENAVRLAEATFQQSQGRLKHWSQIGMQYFLGLFWLFMGVVILWRGLVDQKVSGELALFIGLWGIVTGPATEAIRGMLGIGKDSEK